MQPAAAQLACLQLHTAGFEGVEIRRTRTPLPYACRSDAGRWSACSATIEGTLFSFSGILWPFLFWGLQGIYNHEIHCHMAVCTMTLLPT